MKKIAVVIALALASGLSAQEAALVQSGRLEMTRDDLTELRQQYEDVAASSAYSGRVRDRARRNIELIDARLREGDFRVGDRVVLAVQGEWATPDTFPVEPGPQVTLPIMGRITLRGVLRSELEGHLSQEIGRFIQNPVVTASSLIRLSILGDGISNPGFYVVPSEMLIGEALMLAGGPSPNAALDDLYVDRSGRRIWDGVALQDAMNAGSTLDQMNLRAGDQIWLPQDRPSQFWPRALQYGFLIGTALIFGVRVF